MQRARADLLFGLGWTVLGAAIAVGSWTMDRLEQQGVEPYAVPGLVPGLLGLLLVLFGLGLALRSRRGGPMAEAEEEEGAAEPWRAALGVVLVSGYVFGLLGRGPAFWLSSAIFVFLGILLFEWPERRRAGTLLRGAAQASVIGLASAAAITFVFQEVFLVRLP